MVKTFGGSATKASVCVRYKPFEDVENDERVDRSSDENVKKIVLENRYLVVIEVADILCRTTKTIVDSILDMKQVFVIC